MILCEREIQALVRNKYITIEGCPKPDSKRWSSTALDLTLHGVILEWITDKPLPTGGKAGQVFPFSDEFNVQEMMEDEKYAKKVPIHNEGYPLPPGGFILGFTIEKVSIPHESRLAARVEGKSSLARIGLGIHVTAPTIHAGFGAEEGKPSLLPIQLEIFNLGPWTIHLKAGMRICQLIFEEVREVPTKGYKGQFGEQQQFTVTE
jgi:dCTP deaminase